MKTSNILCGILFAMAATIPFQATAGTLFYVPIPATGTDKQSGIAPENVYTTAVAAGKSKDAARTVNGVTFGTLNGSGDAMTANGVTLSAATGSLINGGGKSDSIQADGAMAEMFSSMVFNDGAGDNSEQYLVLDPATLTAGKSYDLRVYVCNASGENRQVSLSFAGDGKAAVSTDFFNEDDATTSAGGFTEPNQAYYINYRFTWDGVSTPGFTVTQKFGSLPFCFYALTNQEVRDTTNRPSGAVVATEPEPVAAAPRTTIVESDESIGVASDVFYNADSLRRHGRWVMVGTYGRCWQPTGLEPGWRPYTRGHWVWDPYHGWMWESDEDWGWATYHYGRWFYDEDSGWLWAPGKVWAPSWVSWRYGKSYIGWAPLPPAAIAAAGVGISAWADHRWGIGPNAYNFVSMRDFGAPSMSRVLIPRQQNPAIMRDTNNVTNIVNNRRGIFSGGPSFQAVNNVLSRTGGQPIPSVHINRRTDAKPVTADGKFSQLTGGVLAVTAPIVSPTKRTAALPPVADTIKAPRIDKGWNGLPDPTHAAALQAKIAKETPGESAKKAPAALPGIIPPLPGEPAAKTEGRVRPGFPKRADESILPKPGQPMTIPGTVLRNPGHPVPPTPGAPIAKPGQSTRPAETVVAPPGEPVKPLTDVIRKRGKTLKPGEQPVPESVPPGKASGTPPDKPSQPVKPENVTPPQPVPAPIKPATPTPAPEPRAKKKSETPTPSTGPVPAPSQPVKPEKIAPPQPVPAPVKPATPTPAPEPRSKKKSEAATPVPQPVPAPVKPSTPAVPAPVAKPTPRPDPEPPTRVKPAAPVAPAAPAAPAPVAKPTPRPAPPVTIPVKPAAPAPPTAPAAPETPRKGGKPTPTPAPGEKR